MENNIKKFHLPSAIRNLKETILGSYGWYTTNGIKSIKIHKIEKSKNLTILYLQIERSNDKNVYKIIYSLYDHIWRALSNNGLYYFFSFSDHFRFFSIDNPKHLIKVKINSSKEKNNSKGIELLN